MTLLNFPWFSQLACYAHSLHQYILRFEIEIGNVQTHWNGNVSLRCWLMLVDVGWCWLMHSRDWHLRLTPESDTWEWHKRVTLESDTRENSCKHSREHSKDHSKEHSKEHSKDHSRDHSENVLERSHVSDMLEASLRNSASSFHRLSSSGFNVRSSFVRSFVPHR